MQVYMVIPLRNFGRSMPIAPLYEKFSDAQHAAECIRAFTGEPCRVVKLSTLWTTP